MVRQRLQRDQRGIALPMALGIMLVLSIALVAVIAFANSNQQAANYSKAGDKALSLAEAGVSRAANVLENSVDPSVAGALSSGSDPLEGGTSSYSGSLSGLTWTVTGTGTVANPAAGGASLTRTVSAQYQISVAGTVWDWTYADATAGCLTIANNATFSAPLFTRGSLCMSNGSYYNASKLHVGGTVTPAVNSSIGTAALPITSANLVGGCTGGSPNPHPCGAADNVYASSITQTPSGLTKPPVELQRWYDEARPGPKNSCTSGSVPGDFDNEPVATRTLNRSRPAFELTPSSGYTCRFVSGATTIGELTWTPGSPGSLTIAGTIFFDGDIDVTRNAVYSGRATIYSSGKVTLTNGTRLCGIAACDATWNTAANTLLFVAGSATDQYGFTLSNNAIYQGAAYVVNDYLLRNNAANWGPVVARQISVENNATQIQSLITLPPGAPGIEKTVHSVPGSWRG